VIQDFDALRSGVSLRITHEVLGGTWEALREGRADLVIGATNEPPSIPNLRWFELGVLEWVFAVSARHPLAAAQQPLKRDDVVQYRSVVVADSSRRSEGRSYGLLAGQPVLAVPSMRAKIRAQCAGLGVGWLPRRRVASLLDGGVLVEKRMADPREPNTLFVAWRGDHEGRGLRWWLERLRQPRLAKRLVDGIDVG
jgi:DNA-binding transcriptional LysR family regulator